METSMVWPTLGSRTAETEQNRTVSEHWRNQRTDSNLWIDVDVHVEVFAIALLLMLSSEVLVSAVWNFKKFSVLEQIVLVYRTLSGCQLVPLVRLGHRKTAPTESVCVGARHDQVAVVKVTCPTQSRQILHTGRLYQVIACRWQTLIWRGQGRMTLVQFWHLQSYLQNGWSQSRQVLYISRIYQVSALGWQTTL